MGMKRLVMCFLFVLLAISFVSADSCSLQTSCNADNRVLRLSSTTNAHGEIWSQTNYAQILCCDFTGIHTDNGNNKVLGLSSTTNAHAEIPSLSNYGTEVYFGNLLCSSGAGSCPGDYDIQMVSLSDTTNAHLGAFSEYNTKICCKQNEYCGDNITQPPELCDEGPVYLGPGHCHTDCSGKMGDGVVNLIEGVDPYGDIDNDGILNWKDDDMDGDGIPNNEDSDIDGNGLPDVPLEECDDGNLVSGDGCSNTGQLETTLMWTDENGNEIGNDVNGSVVEAHIGQTVKLVWNNTGQSPGSTTFEIYERDLISDDDIRTGGDAITGTFSSEGNGVVTAEWTITQEDYEATEEGDTDEFYFIIDTQESDDDLTILPEDYTEWCMNYDTEEGCSSCGYSGCNAAANSVNIKVFEAYPEQWGDTRCGDTVEVGDSNCSYIVNCFCEWDSENESCGHQWNMIPYNCEAGFPGLGSCAYSEDTSDNCDDGFLEYSWDGTWEWANDNGYANYTDGPSQNVGDYVLDGLYYYDPDKTSENCVGGTNTVACPAQIQLPFFGFYNLVASLILISVIYGLLIKRRK